MSKTKSFNHANVEQERNASRRAGVLATYGGAGVANVSPNETEGGLFRTYPVYGKVLRWPIRCLAS
jgi:hypothetical protein